MAGTPGISKKSAYVAILAMGIVSMLGDIVYESGRGIAPDYLRFLGASALLVGLVSGFGEFLGYGARLISGSLSDKSQRYWLFIFLGYGLILAIPLIGLTFSIEAVIALLILERLGKALRSPSRDTVVSIVSKSVGAGKAFGIHEAVDQIGAILGPLMLGGVMFYTANSYPVAFKILFVPFILMLAALAYTYRKVGKRIEVEAKNTKVEARSLGNGFWIYSAAVFLNTLGLIPVALILFSGSSILQTSDQQWLVPLLYVVVQAVDAPMALVAGHFFDKVGVRFLVLPFVLSIFPAFFVSSGGLIGIVIACVTFGLVLGMQESIYRASIRDLVPLHRSGIAYGILNATLGLGTLASGVIFGALMNQGYPSAVLVGFALLLQIFAVATLLGNRQPFQEVKCAEKKV